MDSFGFVASIFIVVCLRISNSRERFHCPNRCLGKTLGDRRNWGKKRRGRSQSNAFHRGALFVFANRKASPNHSFTSRSVRSAESRNTMILRSRRNQCWHELVPDTFSKSCSGCVLESIECGWQLQG